MKFVSTEYRYPLEGRNDLYIKCSIISLSAKPTESCTPRHSCRAYEKKDPILVATPLFKEILINKIVLITERSYNELHYVHDLSE